MKAHTGVDLGEHVVIPWVQAEAAAEAKLRGPHSFPLERMLATFWELQHGSSEDSTSADALADAQSNEVIMQVSSLVSLRFLSQVRRDFSLSS